MPDDNWINIWVIIKKHLCSTCSTTNVTYFGAEWYMLPDIRCEKALDSDHNFLSILQWSQCTTGNFEVNLDWPSRYMMKWGTDFFPPDGQSITEWKIVSFHRKSKLWPVVMELDSCHIWTQARNRGRGFVHMIMAFIRWCKDHHLYVHFHEVLQVWCHCDFVLRYCHNYSRYSGTRLNGHP